MTSNIGSVPDFGGSKKWDSLVFCIHLFDKLSFARFRSNSLSKNECKIWMNLLWFFLIHQSYRNRTNVWCHEGIMFHTSMKLTRDIFLYLSVCVSVCVCVVCVSVMDFCLSACVYLSFHYKKWSLNQNCHYYDGDLSSPVSGCLTHDWKVAGSNPGLVYDEVHVVPLFLLHGSFFIYRRYSA